MKLFGFISGVTKYLSEGGAGVDAQLANVADMRGKLDAISRSMAMIEFAPNGEVLDANANFLQTLGYSLDEIKGKHHSLFVDATYRASAEYRQFWEKLARGEFDAGQYKRIAKNGQEIWIQASYNPVFNEQHQVVKVIKFATDITEQKKQYADFSGKLAAISKSMAVIEFDLNGSIITANDNFLQVLGYSLSEIQGKHHRIFVEESYRNSVEYQRFWEKLGRGEYDAAQYKRIAKNGQEIWIQASYNPILDANGKPCKVVKFAIDVTAQVKASQALVQAVAQTQQVMEAAQSGDLTGRIPLEGKTGELVKLCSGINALVQNMVDVLHEVKVSSDAITTAAKEIASGNADLSQRTEEQASSLEETASSMEELTSTVKQNAENARQANQLAIAASNVASKGGEVVSSSVDTMAKISEASKKIADIISVIDGIAFQTNILALNAAVEAARAGEQGRGFAVVAGEVRNLAQRSANAAKEIKVLITDSVSKVESGTAQVSQAGKTMEEIVSSIQRVTEIMSEITAASAEQSQGIEQVNQAVTQMDEATQQNAALVEESAAAAESLEEQALNMSQIVQRFKLNDEHSSSLLEKFQSQTVTQKNQKALSEKKAIPHHDRRAHSTSQSKQTLTSPQKQRGNHETNVWSEF